MKLLYTSLIFILLFSCTLSGEQESSLNNALISYIDARNNGVLVNYVEFTHPNAIEYYKELGDRNFIEKFDLNRIENKYFLQDGNVVEIETKNKVIHVKYEFIAIVDNAFEIEKTEHILYAISMDDGINWHFIDQDDYQNDHILESKHRLFKE